MRDIWYDLGLEEMVAVCYLALPGPPPARYVPQHHPHMLLYFNDIVATKVACSKVFWFSPLNVMP